MSDSTSDPKPTANHRKYPSQLDSSLYNLKDDELDFYKQSTGIDDDEKLKEHIIAVQAEAYKVNITHENQGEVCSLKHRSDISLSLHLQLQIHEVIAALYNHSYLMILPVWKYRGFLLISMCLLWERKGKEPSFSIWHVAVSEIINVLDIPEHILL